MSLLPTTRINSVVSNGGVSGVVDGNIPGVQDEDILLVDFQPVVVPNNQILSSPSTTSTAMYPIPPPVGPLPGAHMAGLSQHPTLSSDGVTTPISVTGSSGKANSNPNNFSLVNLSNHVHHNNTSREESDFNYPTNQQSHRPHLPNNLTSNAAIVPNDATYDDEDDEFARQQAMAQPNFMLNKRRSRRFVTRDSHNHSWDNSNHVGFHHQPGSSSLSSSEDSDTEFLMGTRKTAYTRKSVRKVVDPHPMNHSGGGNISPSATVGLLPNLGNRKRVRRRRPSARNRKPAANQHDKINPSDVLSYCCCLCQEDPQRSHHSSPASSIRSRYLRVTCFIMVIIIVAVLTSITLSLQRKVDSLDWSLKKLDQTIGSPLSSESISDNLHKPSVETLVSTHNELNSTITSLKLQLDSIASKLQDFQGKLNNVVSKPVDGVAEVKATLGTLGSRVEELSSTIEKVNESIQQLKQQAAAAGSSTKPNPDGSSIESQSSKST